MQIGHRSNQAQSTAATSPHGQVTCSNTRGRKRKTQLTTQQGRHVGGKVAVGQPGERRDKGSKARRGERVTKEERLRNLFTRSYLRLRRLATVHLWMNSDRMTEVVFMYFISSTKCAFSDCAGSHWDLSRGLAEGRKAKASTTASSVPAALHIQARIIAANKCSAIQPSVHTQKRRCLEDICTARTTISPPATFSL